MAASDVTTATHTYYSAGSHKIEVTAYDSYTNPDPTAQPTSPPPHIDLAPTKDLTVTVTEGPETVTVAQKFTITTLPLR